MDVPPTTATPAIEIPSATGAASSPMASKWTPLTASRPTIEPGDHAVPATTSATDPATRTKAATFASFLGTGHPATNIAAPSAATATRAPATAAHAITGLHV